MRKLLTAIVRIAMLDKGPQDLPWSPALLATCIAAFALVNVLGQHALGMGTDAELRTLMLVAFSLVMLRLLLAGRGLSERLVQAATAWFACGTLLSLLVLPVSNLVVSASREEAPTLNPLVALTWLTLFAWSFAVDAHILRHAMNLRWAPAVLLAIALFMLSRVLDALLFAAAPA